MEQCNKYTGQDCKTLARVSFRPMDIRVYHPFKQPLSMDRQRSGIDLTTGGINCWYFQCKTTLVKITADVKLFVY